MSLYLVLILMLLLGALLWLVFDLKKKWELSAENTEERERLAAMQEALRHIVDENRELRREIDRKIRLSYRKNLRDFF